MSSIEWTEYNLMKWGRFADDPERSRVAPKSFRQAFEGAGPKDFVRFAWRLFCDTRKPHTRQEVLDYIRMRKQEVVDNEDIDESTVGSVASHFLDSGAFTIWTKAEKWAKETGKKDEDYYNTPEFWDYIDEYANFIRKNGDAIDLYANLDAIGFPDITMRNQRYLEDQWGLKPVPVIHYRTDLKWLREYITKGYNIIGLGGLVGSTSQDGCRGWLDKCFDIVCDTPKRLPKVRLHGFGVTTYDLLIRYPWFSVDSTSWTKIGAFGGILVPHKRRGKWDFSEQPYLMKVSSDSPDRRAKGKHVLTLTNAERSIVLEWLSYIQVPFGRTDPKGEVVEHGVTTRHSERKIANIIFFEKLREWLPPYPWAFQYRRRPGFGLKQ